MAFKNRHLSVSRAKTYDSCPKSFELKYIRDVPQDTSEPAQFGSLCHSVLENLAKYGGGLTDVYNACWAESGLVGQELYHEGLAFLEPYVREWARAPKEMVGIEVEFKIKAGQFDVLGYMDRVDKIDETTIAVIDYKTARKPFTDRELESDLQMSVYYAAARQLYPWAKTIRMEIHALRYNRIHRTQRTDREAQKALEYVAAIGLATEQGKAFPARLGPFCGWCDVREHCDTYKHAVTSDKVLTEGNFKSLQEQLVHIGHVAKLAFKKKKELESILGK